MAKRFFKRLLRSHQGETRKIVTDKLSSYGVAQAGDAKVQIDRASSAVPQYSRRRLQSVQSGKTPEQSQVLSKIQGRCVWALGSRSGLISKKGMFSGLHKLSCQYPIWVMTAP